MLQWCTLKCITLGAVLPYDISKYPFNNHCSHLLAQVFFLFQGSQSSFQMQLFLLFSSYALILSDIYCVCVRLLLNSVTVPQSSTQTQRKRWCDRFSKQHLRVTPFPVPSPQQTPPGLMLWIRRASVLQVTCQRSKSAPHRQVQFQGPGSRTEPDPAVRSSIMAACLFHKPNINKFAWK